VAITWLCVLSVAEYATAGRSAPAPRRDCPQCGKPMAFDGSYPRQVLEAGVVYRIFVDRARCSACGVGESLCPDFVLRRRLDSANAVGAGVLSRAGIDVGDCAALRRSGGAHHALVVAALHGALRGPVAAPGGGLGRLGRRRSRLDGRAAVGTGSRCRGHRRGVASGPASPRGRHRAGLAVGECCRRRPADLDPRRSAVADPSGVDRSFERALSCGNAAQAVAPHGGGCRATLVASQGGQGTAAGRARTRSDRSERSPAATLESPVKPSSPSLDRQAPSGLPSCAFGRLGPTQVPESGPSASGSRVSSPSEPSVVRS